MSPFVNIGRTCPPCPIGIDTTVFCRSGLVYYLSSHWYYYFTVAHWWPDLINYLHSQCCVQECTMCSNSVHICSCDDFTGDICLSNYRHRQASVFFRFCSSYRSVYKSLKQTRSIWKMLAPFATASRLTPIHQMSLAVLSRAACASMSTTTSTTTFFKCFLLI